MWANTVKQSFGKPKVQKESKRTQYPPLPISVHQEFGLTSGPAAILERTVHSMSAVTIHSVSLSTDSFLSCQWLLDSNLTCLLLLFSQVSMVRPHDFKLGVSVHTMHFFFSFYSYPIKAQLWKSWSLKDHFGSECMLEGTDQRFRKWLGSCC